MATGIPFHPIDNVDLSCVGCGDELKEADLVIEDPVEIWDKILNRSVTMIAHWHESCWNNADEAEAIDREIRANEAHWQQP